MVPSFSKDTQLLFSLAKCLDNFRNADVSAGETAEEPDGEDEDVLDECKLIELRVLPADHNRDYRREDKGQGGTAHRADQRNEESKLRDGFCEDDCKVLVEKINLVSFFYFYKISNLQINLQVAMQRIVLNRISPTTG